MWIKSTSNYFPINVAMNKGINKTFNDIIKSGIKPLSANEFKILSKSDRY